MCENTVIEEPFKIKCNPDFYKTQKMLGKVVNENPFRFKLVLDCHKTQEMCKKVVY